MRPSDPRAAPPRRGKLLRAFAVTAALLMMPWAAPEAAARAAKPRADQAQPQRRAQAAPARRVATAARPARPAPRRVAAKPAIAGPAAAEVPGIRRVVVSALDGAIRSTGIDPTLLAALAWQESRFDPRARNRRSTARGLMQFTEATWLEAVRDHGPQHGLRYEAAVLTTDPASGTISTRQPRTRSRILELRDNPRYAAALAAERISRARQTLTRTLGRPVEPADLYMVHLLGPAGAQRFLSAMDRTPGRPAAEFVGADSLMLNREVFVARGNARPLSLAEVHAWVARSIAGQREMHAPLFAVLDAPEMIEVADAR
ncbi:transglycosylase SLT domain-containing protein [Dankookia sp. GCM10030260]|uniref:transglycosylase SLT domain-containing protein n=1 Tax=Dankookia sp. GCM10030260 TaxID=3273390 RepID=UPI00360EC10C